MNTTYDIFPTSNLIARSKARAVGTIESQSAENAPQTAPRTTKASFPWEMAGIFLVLLLAMALVGLWSWTLVEFARFFVEIMRQSNSLEIVLQ